MGAKTKQIGGGTATPTANNWNQFLNQQLQGGMNQATSNAQQPGMQQQGFQQALVFSRWWRRRYGGSFPL
jgi:hypothetical protein